jgi:hypothetical protein
MVVMVAVFPSLSFLYLTTDSATFFTGSSIVQEAYFYGGFCLFVLFEKMGSLARSIGNL